MHIEEREGVGENRLGAPSVECPRRFFETPGTRWNRFWEEAGQTEERRKQRKRKERERARK
jgi:hypothetical protein